MGRTYFARRKVSFLLLFQDCLQAQARVCVRHRSRRTHRGPLRTILTNKRGETDAIQPEPKTNKQKQEDNIRATRNRLRDLPEWLEEFRQSRRYRSASTRKHFSWLRFGTSCESGSQEAQYLYSLPKKSEIAGGIWKDFLQTLRNWEIWTRQKSVLEDSMQRK